MQARGRVTNDAQQPVTTRFLSVYFPESGRFESTQITDGALAFSLPDFYDTQNVQFFDMNPFHTPTPRVELTNWTLPTDYRGTVPVRSPEVANYLALLAKYRQYREVFNVPVPVYNQPDRPKRTTWTADRRYDPDQYTALSDLASFVSEIVPDGRVVGKGSKRSIRLKYAEKSIYNRRAPWFMVNGWMTSDEQVVLKMPFREIDELAIYNSKQNIATQLDPAMVSRGLVELTTSDGKTPASITNQPNNQTMRGLYAVRRFPEPPAASDAPFLPPVLHWTSNLVADKSGRVTVRFRTSDSLGQHWITVSGVDRSGRPMTGRWPLRVIPTSK